MAAVPYTDAIIASSNYRPLSDVNTLAYAVYPGTLIPTSEYAPLPSTPTSPSLPTPETLTPSEVTGVSGGGSARPASGMVYPRKTG